jgi:DNA-binding beta-propeller fold protein YncE
MIFGFLLIGPSMAYGQFQQGGVDHPGEWYVGEGLEEGDFFQYRLCHVDHNDCTDFELSLTALENQTDFWNFNFRVIDENTLYIEDTLLNNVTFKTTNTSESLAPFANAYSNSLVWLSQFATGDDSDGAEGPKDFSAKSWGKIGNIGGEQVVPTAIETISVPGGTYETILITWKVGGATSKVWVLDEFPFPIKARTFTHVSEGIPPLEYEFELLSCNGCVPPFFEKEFGVFGDDKGEFDLPLALALDTNSNFLYVADSDNDRIQIIDVDGQCDENDAEYLAEGICFVDEFGETGNNEGEFDIPSALTLDMSTNLLYIADKGNDRIQIIDIDGNCSGTEELTDDVCFVDEFGGSGNGEGEFDEPTALALDTSNDLLYIADTGNNRIQIIDVDGNCGNDELADDVCFVDEFGESGNGEGDFDFPSGLALHDTTDFLYIADTDNNRIQIIDVDGNCDSNDDEYLANDVCFVDKFGQFGNDNGDFKDPVGLALDPTNDILYISEIENNRIQFVDIDGNCFGDNLLADGICFEGKFGKPGTNEIEFDMPSDLVLDGAVNLLYIADTDNNRIQVVDISKICDGGVCFMDIDGDGVEDSDDNCPSIPNPSQTDEDGDGIGDDCESDFDNDGVIDDFDNCVEDSNPLQENIDGDSFGDACDEDFEFVSGLLEEIDFLNSIIASLEEQIKELQTLIPWPDTNPAGKTPGPPLEKGRP